MKIQEFWIVVGVWLLLLVRGFFYSNLFPLWEGYDEWAHYAYVEHLVSHGVLASPRTRVSEEIAQSLKLVPLPWMMRDSSPDRRTHDAYWRLPSESRRELELALANLPRELRDRESREGDLLYEAQQPPLYYVLLAGPGLAFGGLSLVARVYLLRYLSVIFASVVVPLGYLAARRVFGSRELAAGVVAVIALMPGLLINVCRVGNESLAILLYSWLLLLCLGLVDRPADRRLALWAGVILGLGLLTKAYFLSALAALSVLFAWCFWARPSARAKLAVHAILALAIALGMAGWWYGRTRTLTGSWSGQLFDAALGPVPLTEIVKKAPAVDWRSAVDSTFVSHVWFGNWSFLQVRSWIYRFFRYLALLALVGFLVLAARLSLGRPAPVSGGHFLALTALYGFFGAGLAYHVLITFAVTGMSSTAGWYLYALVVAEIILATMGLQGLLSEHRRAWVPGGAAVCFGLLDLYAAHFVLIPYYTGLLAHNEKGVLPQLALARLPAGSLRTVIERLEVNRPAFVTGPVVVAGWVCYVAATLGLVAVAIWTGLRLSRPGPLRRGGSDQARQEARLKNSAVRENTHKLKVRSV